jgi:hypothetical protein
MTEPETKESSTWANLRLLIAFQIKLALDAARDFALSPISIVAFLIDTVLKTPPEKSLYNRLMVLGRKSDVVINLFDQHEHHDHYTVDETLRGMEKGVEQALQRGVEDPRPSGQLIDTGAEHSQKD